MINSLLHESISLSINNNNKYQEKRINIFFKRFFQNHSNIIIEKNLYDFFGISSIYHDEQIHSSFNFDEQQEFIIYIIEYIRIFKIQKYKGILSNFKKTKPYIKDNYLLLFQLMEYCFFSKKAKNSLIKNICNIILSNLNNQKKLYEKIIDLISNNVNIQDISNNKKIYISQNNQINKQDFKLDYKIFSQKFDKIIHFRTKKITNNNFTINNNKPYIFNEKLNYKILPRIITNKNYDNDDIFSYYSNFNNKKANHIISIVIDNSYSIYPYASNIIKIINKIASFLQNNNIVFEVIGYTTQYWDNSKTYNLWKKKGYPKNPGRLNDALYIIYKNYNDEKICNLEFMLQKENLKENLDGEALLHSFNKINKSNIKNKLIIHISDNICADINSSKYNKNNYLSNYYFYIKNIIQKNIHIISLKPDNQSLSYAIKQIKQTFNI